MIIVSIHSHITNQHDGHQASIPSLMISKRLTVVTKRRKICNENKRCRQEDKDESADCSRCSLDDPLEIRSMHHASARLYRIREAL